MNSTHLDVSNKEQVSLDSITLKVLDGYQDILNSFLLVMNRIFKLEIKKPTLELYSLGLRFHKSAGTIQMDT